MLPEPDGIGQRRDATRATGSAAGIGRGRQPMPPSNWPTVTCHSGGKKSDKSRGSGGRAPSLRELSIRIDPWRRCRPLPRKFFRRAICQAAVRALLIVVDPPCFDLAPGIGQILKPVRIQALVAEPAIETLDETVLHWLAGLDVYEPDLTPFRPGHETAAGEFRPVVDANANEFRSIRQP